MGVAKISGMLGYVYGYLHAKFEVNRTYMCMAMEFNRERLPPLLRVKKTELLWPNQPAQVVKKYMVYAVICRLKNAGI